MLARQVPQWLSVVIAFLLLSACATMFYGTTQEVPVTSVPDGAEVRIQGKLIGNTPVTITLDRKPDHELEISQARPISRLRSPSLPCSLRQGGSLVRPDGPVGLGRPDSQAYQGAAATQLSNSTATGTSPGKVSRTLTGSCNVFDGS